MDPEDVLRAEAVGEDLAATLEDIGRARMPFGRFGPHRYPPDGVPLIDLPFEYLEWFEKRGWPRGRLGILMTFVYHTKLAGADEIFDPWRTRFGGRTNLRLSADRPRTSHSFEDE